MMIVNTEGEKYPPHVLTPRDDVKKSVSEVLKRVDSLIRKGELDQAEYCVGQAREIDPKNIYAYAFEERIQLLKQQALENAVTASVCEHPVEKRSIEQRQQEQLTPSFQDILISSQSALKLTSQESQPPPKSANGKSRTIQFERVDPRGTPLKMPEQHPDNLSIHSQRGGATHVSTEDQSNEDRNLKIQRIIKIAVDAARKEVEQRQQEIREQERDELLHTEQILITQAADAARRAEEGRQAEIRRKAEEKLFRRFQEQQKFSRDGQPKKRYANSPDSLQPSVDQTQEQTPLNPVRQETLSRYKFVLLSAWADGAVSEEEGATLGDLRRSLSISSEEHLRIEEEVKRETYIEAFKRAWNSGTISPENASVLTELRERFNISTEQHLQIESTLLWEIQPVKNRPTLLLVDDDERLLGVVSKTLNHAGFITRSVTTSDEAYSYLRESSPDLILCDVNLETSTMGGFAFYEKVREMEQLRETPFIFLSGLSDEALVRAGKEMGVDDYLSKPVSEETLVATIKGKLRRYHELRKRNN